MKQLTKEVDRRIAELNLRDEEIERALHELFPARVKADTPIQYEDYTGATGEQKRRKRDALMTERKLLRSELRQTEKQMYRLMRPHKE